MVIWWKIKKFICLVVSKLQASVQKQILYLDVEFNDSDWKRKLSFQPLKVQIVTWELEGMLTHFVPLISFDTALKTSENLWVFFDVFIEYQKRSVAWNGLKDHMRGK